MIARPSILVASALFVLAAPVAAEAQQKKSLREAREYFDAGKQAYKAGKYQFAVKAFAQAYRIVRRPSIIFSLAQAHRRQYFVGRKPRNLKRALELFKQYLRDVPNGNRRNHAVEHIANLEPLWLRVEASLDSAAKKASAQPAAETTQLMISSQTPNARGAIGGDAMDAIPVTKTVTPGAHKVRVEAPGYFGKTVTATAVKDRLIVMQVDLTPRPATLRVRGSVGGRLLIDGRERGTLPLSRPVSIPAGEHFVAVVKRGHVPYAATLTLRNGERRDVAAGLRTSRQRRASYYVMAGAGGLLLASGVSMLFAWSAQSGAQDITDGSAAEMLALTPAERDEHNRLLTRRNRARTGGYILGAAAVATGIAGALLYLVDQPQPRAPRKELTATTGPTGLGLGIAGLF